MTAANHDRLKQLFLELVRIDSLSRHERLGGDDKSGCAVICEVVHPRRRVSRAGDFSDQDRG